MQITLFLCGDLMTGRGIDQILPHPSSPELMESYVRDARDYVELAESENGPIPRHVLAEYIWGPVLPDLDVIPDFRVVNLETSITHSSEFWSGKEIHYRMHPDNVAVLRAAGIDACVLANNHVLDFGYPGLLETLDVLHAEGIQTAGAGRNLAEARRPAILSRANHAGRVLVFAAGDTSSGVFPEWAAAPDRPGVDLLPGLSGEAAAELVARIRQEKRSGDVVVVSVHWGSNWGYEVPPEQVEFAHRLIDGGVDVVHGHSSHHPRPIEVYRGRLVLYGCGDFLTDYEGISGHEAFRSDLSLMYFVTVDLQTGSLVDLEMRPLQMRRFRLRFAEAADVRWIGSALDRVSTQFGTRVELGESGALVARVEAAVERQPPVLPDGR